MSDNNSTPRTAVVTGGSSGLGVVYADRLARRGYDLLLVGRDKKRLDAVAAGVSGGTGRRAETLVADLTDPAALGLLEERLRTDETVDLLVNSAGLARFGPIVDAGIASLDQQIALNVTAPTRLSKAALEGMARRDRGTIVNISSTLAFWLLPVNAVHAATKNYILTFTQALQTEFAETPIRLQAVVPGAVRTEFWTGSGIDLATSIPEEGIMSVDDAVDAALAGLDAGEAVTIPGLADVTSWQAFEKARQELPPQMSRAEPAARYRS